MSTAGRHDDETEGHPPPRQRRLANAQTIPSVFASETWRQLEVSYDPGRQLQPDRGGMPMRKTISALTFCAAFALGCEKTETKPAEPAASASGAAAQAPAPPKADTGGPI